jgi:hypothetical protein
MPHVLDTQTPRRSVTSVRAKDLRGTLMAALKAQHLTSRLQTQQQRGPPST